MSNTDCGNMIAFGFLVAVVTGLLVLFGVSVYGEAVSDGCEKALTAMNVDYSFTKCN